MSDLQQIVEQLEDLSIVEMEELQAILQTQIELKAGEKRKKPFILDLHPGAITISDDFNDPLPDAFWFGEE